MDKLELNDRGYLKKRESTHLEFKESFHYGDSLLTYARTMAGMANNHGGEIIFGIKDSPRIPVGLTSNKFEDFDPRIMNQVLLEYFSRDIDWEFYSFNQNNLQFGVIKVYEANTKPIVCTKSKQNVKLREGAIYYRYRGETKEIRYPELSSILQEEKDKEKKLWMNHIQSIAQIGPQYVQIVDALKGQLDVGGAKVLIDEGLINKLKLIKEGQFSEKSGAPTLKLIGEIDGMLSDDHVIYTETAYPHTQGSITDILPINSYEFQAVVWKLNVKGNPRYHLEIKVGNQSVVQKYSEKFLNLIKSKIRKNNSFVKTTKKEYSDYRKENN